MTNSDWWKPNNLSRSQDSYRDLTNISDLDPHNDFGSYRRVLLGDDFAQSGIALHNDLSPLEKVRVIQKQLQLQSPLQILDAGCGLGFTTDAISRTFPGASVLGIDISLDAIAFAKKNFPNSVFRAEPIDPESAPIGSFDLIFCFEFYPFTRNRDVLFQSEMIRYLSTNLSPNGQIIISQTWREVDGLPFIYDEVTRECSSLKFSVVNIPHPRIAAKLPLQVARRVAEIGEFLTRKELIKKVITVTRENL